MSRNPRKYADRLLAEGLRRSTRKGGRSVVRRKTLDDAAVRAGYSDAEEMLAAERLRRRQEVIDGINAEKEKREAERAEKRRLAELKAELERCLVFQSQMGDRVRAALRSREAGERVVAENNANSERIAELRALIKRLE